MEGNPHMTEHRDRRESATGDTAATSFDEPGPGGGYGLSDRFEELKAAMRLAEFHGHLANSQLRDAVVDAQTPQSKSGRKKRRKPGSLNQPARSEG